MLLKEIFLFILVIFTKSISEECIDSLPSFKNCTSVKNTSDNYSCCYFTAKINNKNSAACIRILKDLTIIKDKIQSKKEILDCKEDGNPKESLLKYNIQLLYRKHIKTLKIKTNELFTLAFCKRVTNNIIKFKIYEYMTNDINNTIKDSFGDFKFLENKIKSLYFKYSLTQKKKMIENLDEIYHLETENISTFNIDILNKLNSLNKHINYFIFGKRNKYKTICEKLNSFLNMKVRSRSDRNKRIIKRRKRRRIKIRKKMKKKE
jgi:hypothetical protein